MKKIQQIDQVHSVLNKIMGKLSCFIKIEEQEFPAGFVAYNKLDAGLELRLITEQKDHPSKRFVVMYHQGQDMIIIEAV